MKSFCSRTGSLFFLFLFFFFSCYSVHAGSHLLLSVVALKEKHLLFPIRLL